jgi:DNA-binding NarL/FixJ family response regulator
MPSSQADAAPGAAARIFLVDDHAMIREGLRGIIGPEDDLEVCGEAATGRGALRQIPEEKPDLAIVDLTLEDMEGLELIKDLRARCPKVRILTLSMRDESIYAERVLRAGASGYLMKEASGQETLAAIRKVLDGDVVLSPEMSSRALRHLLGKREAGASLEDQLSDRELEVFQLLGQGFGPNQIADKLHLSLSTVETYRGNLRNKLDLPDARALRRRAIQWVQEHGSI